MVKNTRVGRRGLMKAGGVAMLAFLGLAPRVKAQTNYIDLNGVGITGLPGPVNLSDATNKEYVDTKIGSVVEDTSPQLGGDLDAQSYRVTNLGAPVNDNDAARKIDISSAADLFVIGEDILGQTEISTTSTTYVPVSYSYYRMFTRPVLPSVPNGYSLVAKLRAVLYNNTDAKYTLADISGVANSEVTTQDLGTNQGIYMNRESGEINISAGANYTVRIKVTGGEGKIIFAKIVYYAKKN